MNRRIVLGLAVGATALAATGEAPANTHAPEPRAHSAKAAPRIEIMVIGASRVLIRPRRVRLAAGRVQIGGRSCAVPAGTALAGLLAAKLPIHVSNQSGCDPAGMFVTRIRHDANSGPAGWEYRVGHQADSSYGAGDPGGRLHSGQQLLWYWCVRAGACQRTLSLSTSVTGQTLMVHVVGYDVNGHGRPTRGATVQYGSQSLSTGQNGSVTFPVLKGAHKVYASKAGLVRSFPVTVHA